MGHYQRSLVSSRARSPHRDRGARARLLDVIEGHGEQRRKHEGRDREDRV